MAQHRIHEFRNLPATTLGWSELVEPAKDTYWQARRDGKDETQSLLHAIDTVVGLMDRRSR